MLMIFNSLGGGLSRRRWSPATTSPPGPFVAIFVAVEADPPDQVWLPQMVPPVFSVPSGIAMQ